MKIIPKFPLNPKETWKISYSSFPGSLSQIYVMKPLFFSCLKNKLKRRQEKRKKTRTKNRWQI